jgi:hypothetical protein
VLCKQNRKRWAKLKNNPPKVFIVANFVVPLHPLSTKKTVDSNNKEAIFESIT